MSSLSHPGVLVLLLFVVILALSAIQRPRKFGG